MIQWTALQQAPPWAAALTRRAAGSPVTAVVLALLLSALVALLDYAAGYELRLAILYLVPIALATWAGGVRAGLLIVATCCLFWLLSFGSTHPYSSDFFFYWEGVAMVAVYVTFVLLLARLRSTLTRADEGFLSVLEELYSAVYVVDLDSDKVLYANRSLARLIDTDPRALGAEELGQRLGLGELVVEDVHDAQDAHAARSANNESIEEGFVSREVRNPASGQWYLVRIGQIPWQSSRRVSLRMITDISAQKHSQALKRQHQEMLHQTARLAALAEIASSLAHEVNQPLMAIASYNDACLRMLGAPAYDHNEVVTALQRCREQALRAGRIISRVRDFIRSRRPSPSHCDINALVREALELLETQLEDNAVTTQLSLSESPLLTHADQTLLTQVIVNLVHNAIDAMATAEPSRRQLSVLTAKAADGSIVVSVSDQGMGIPEAIGDQLFTPFLTTKPQGLGLGLSICRSVVEAHGGRIGHRSNPDGGCTFHFTLPTEID